MKPLGNDRYGAAFVPPAPGRYVYGVTAWVDHFESWRHELERRVDADDIRSAALAGAELIEAAAGRAEGADVKTLADWGARLRAGAGKASADARALQALALDETLAEVAARYPDRSRAATFPLELPLVADRERARFSTWYELFPRSASGVPGRHGTFRDVEARLPYVAELGFDVLYLPPIHPIGRDKRKGTNNSLSPQAGRRRQPVGDRRGRRRPQGHPARARHARGFPPPGAEGAREHGIEIALDIAFQCAPDHPYVSEHPEWFRTVPTAASSTPRIRRRNTRTSIRSTSRARTGDALWARARRACSTSGSARG